jgi:hypothetical protein
MKSTATKTEQHNMSRYDTALWKELVKIQNTMPHIDILTITGFMNDEQFAQHVANYRTHKAA